MISTMIKLIESKTKTYEQRCEEYNEYLRNHIRGVKDTYNQILRPIILKDFDSITEQRCLKEVESHDQSKYSNDEYNAYLDNFYPAKENHKTTDDEKAAYDLAWLIHQHRNPHHWQYWCLLRDERVYEAIDMPIEYIVAMLCDWHSFTRRDPDNTAYNWYKTNKDKFVFSKNTEKLVKKYIEYLKEPLPPIDNNENDGE